MSRSYRKKKITGVSTNASDKKDKQSANKRLRCATKRALKNNEEVLPEKREISDVYDFAKDGKTYHKNIAKKDMRK